MLAGGRSSRFGSDKAAALLHGRALADHAAAALAPHVSAVVTIGRADDRPAPDLGPLGGIAGALLHAEAAGYASVLTIGCDMPLVPAALLAALARSAPACCGDAPVLGHWPAALGRALATRLATADERSVRRWAAEIGATIMPAPAALANVNTPADLRAL